MVENVAQRPAMPRPWPLFKESLVLFRGHARILLLVVLTISLPVAILSTYVVNPTSDNTLSAYLTFAQLSMNAAIIYAIVRILSHRTVGLREAYYRSSAVLVRLLLLSVALLVLALPLLMGVLIFGYGVVAPGTTLSLAERGLLTALALLIAAPGILLLVRCFWAIYAIFETEDGPVLALRYSWRLTRGRTWSALGRLVAMIGLLMAVLAIPIILFAVLANVTKISLFSLILQVIVALVVLPLSNIYMYKYYQRLKA